MDSWNFGYEGLGQFRKWVIVARMLEDWIIPNQMRIQPLERDNSRELAGTVVSGTSTSIP